jgi:hypothetical protein
MSGSKDKEEKLPPGRPSPSSSITRQKRLSSTGTGYQISCFALVVGLEG